jgi:hypothetical protein
MRVHVLRTCRLCMPDTVALAALNTPQASKHVGEVQAGTRLLGTRPHVVEVLAGESCPLTEGYQAVGR